MTQQSWKARKMVPGRDTISTMAMHYGLKPSQIRDIIMSAKSPLLREDGYRGALVMVDNRSGVGVRKTKVIGWGDGQEGVNPDTTKLTKSAILAVAHWRLQIDSAA